MPIIDAADSGRASAVDLGRLNLSVERLCAEYRSHAEAELIGTGLTPATRNILTVLEDVGPRTVPKLARALDVTRQSVQPLVDALVAAGHAELLPNAENRRSPLVRLTGAGHELILSILDAHAATDTRIATWFSAEVLTATRLTLDTLREAYAHRRLRLFPR